MSKYNNKYKTMGHQPPIGNMYVFKTLESEE